METMRQQITDCLKNTIGKYYAFEQDEMDDVVEKCVIYSMLINKMKI